LSLTLVGAYAGWRGSLPDADVDARLELCLRASELPPDDFASTMMPSMFSSAATASDVTDFEAAVRGLSPSGFRTMATAAAADLRPMLGQIAVPTLVVCGDQDVRAPLEVAARLHAGIPSSRLVVLPGVGPVSPVEAPDEVSITIGDFLRSVGP
jgi:pimeloyl-ACP methyl ester carboxylesterase